MGSRRTTVALRRRAAIALAVWAVAFSMLALAAAVPEGLEVTLTATPTNALVDQTVLFHATVHDNHEDASGAHLSFRFAFGDGSGTDWQRSSNATHAYTASGNYTASVQVRDSEDHVGSASVRVHVLPPPPRAPDLRPAIADVAPAHPVEGDSVNLTVVLVNRGTATADSATVTATDLRPNGTAASLGQLSLPSPLSPSDVVALVFGPFRAAGAGDHLLQIRVGDVRPPETYPGGGILNLTMSVAASSSPPPPPTGPQLQILAGLLDPAHPQEGDTVSLRVILWNRGTSAAVTASVDARDVRPNGSMAALGSAPLAESLPPASGVTLALPAFVASGVGNHTIRLAAANVTPPQLSGGGGGLDVPMRVTSASTTPPGGQTAPPPLEFGPLAFGLVGAGIASAAAAALLVLRPRPSLALEPPEAAPPDRSPPPIWPP